MGGKCLFEVGSILTVLAIRVGCYSRWALIILKVGLLFEKYGTKMHFFIQRDEFSSLINEHVLITHINYSNGYKYLLYG